ncbi:alpha-(1,3)-fucosyltransferase C-like [Ostrea edulis]|uniref:alpha-(1,3)-fucosyltransferase C-like n=1 Tax=Ostrea edulis TaxID=37623 RepID=UPI0020953DF6|nr:alpha-(1,3)-fucosyltransferase C-like [Ostrea edulis]XP_048741047.1 alpha-(1,3)-fucosyltransferase C-like [Ostrea edulis]XP_048741048.1 alpha-(1,3)-fucosyltransferase C-like [Ostrea edulis]XP_048741049.1 alpha-(1,3)-fucosyltransferase C-like [Ostrea edulis]XP_048741050.1 alpha-(1,3)-fucosyltransferase C-like [Ostrea edulis]XP_048741051.1 alpha-(1,3)-fucosyltransferase C-like [Ostrea edulis]XP_056001193.1 alpha-(1,3)-fucosyltransferase C-like [Ostrea edulis]XP_056001194.1 alpha-(1,3)-fucos
MEDYKRLFMIMFISTGFFFVLFEFIPPSSPLDILPLKQIFGYRHNHVTGRPAGILQKDNTSIANFKEWRVLWYNIPFYLVNNSNYANSKKCEKHPKCVFSMDKKDLPNSDVVIFTQSYMESVPPRKENNQVWVFNSMESPAFMTQPSPRWYAELDWLMSYRRKSDIQRPYGIIRKRSTPLVKNYTEVFQKKKLFGVWMSGHCPVPSRRKALIQELQKYVQIDMFGSCGIRVCKTRSPYLNECLLNFSRDYKFYFAFENNICEDYTTEKLFNIYLGNLDVIPVINGPSTASLYLPKGTFLSALDYPSPKALAEKLKEIGSSEALFSQYLREKDKYFEIGTDEVFLDAMCKICAIMDKTKGKPERHKETIHQRFFVKGGC